MMRCRPTSISARLQHSAFTSCRARNSGWRANGAPVAGQERSIGSSRDSGYRPSIFSNVTLGGRPNTGPALGNMAFDRIDKVLFVSDLETGMIHSIRGSDGADLGYYDHGVVGRAKFYDAENSAAGSLSAIMFDPRSGARIADCSTGPFERSPECWNFAASGRRVWGLGVRHDVTKNETRLYYAVWSSPTFGNAAAWNAASDDDKRNSVWSIRISTSGNFDLADIRREFLLPDFFVQPNDVNRAGFSQPASDISFSDCSDRPVMLIAERGGIRNLGLSAENPFAFPHEARALRYELDTAGVWRPVGRYDVGYYDRKNDGQPFMRANCAGGIAFGPGYTADWTVDLTKLDQFVWMTGDSLCSPEGPCHLFGAASAGAPGDAAQNVSAQINQEGDNSQVHGAQGQAEGVFDELMPAAALAPYPTGEGSPYPPTGPDQSYLIDTDINVDAAGNLIEAELVRNDATKIGDIAIYEICLPRQQFAFLPPPEPGASPPTLFGHDDQRSHFLVASHHVRMSHYRFGSHNPYWSHNQFRSHHAYWSHSRSGSHNPRWSHSRRGSHMTHMSKGYPPGSKHHTAPSSYKPPPTTNKGGPPGTTTTNKGAPPGPTTITNKGAPPPTPTPPPGGTSAISSGTCSTVAGRTTCTSTSGHTCTTTSGYCIPQAPAAAHQNVLQTPGKSHNAAISRHNAGKSHSGTTKSHSGTATSHKGTTKSHKGTTTSRSRSHGASQTAGKGHSGPSHTGRGHSSTQKSHVNRGNYSHGGRLSDIRLKEDITLLNRLDSGIGIYRFRYKGSDHTAYVGVMAQEVQEIMPSAVRRGGDGYLRVSYERLRLDFLTWDDWQQRAGQR